MFVSSTYRITESHKTYGFPTLNAAYYRITEFHFTYGFATLRATCVCKLYLEHERFTLHLFVRHLKQSLPLYTLPTESVGYNAVLGLLP